MDGERACYIKANYGSDWDADSLYDLTLNTDSLTYDRVVDILVEGLAAKDRLATPEAKARLELMALGYRLKARIATDPRVLVPTLEVASRRTAWWSPESCTPPKRCTCCKRSPGRSAATDRCGSICTGEPETRRGIFSEREPRDPSWVGFSGKRS